MSTSEYIKIYGGNFIIAKRIAIELESIGINPLIKDEGESNRLSGYPTRNIDLQEIYVFKEDSKKAEEIVNRVKAEMEA
ncbi:DUF2007 domain-containing protein [Winogradskyella sp. A3E31]|uniref:DUF2007 domain-containing protein n=1 Tax=Winogradskyella sp. A3E31 TaxID=3349637 RepID=UPI00398B9131